MSEANQIASTAANDHTTPVTRHTLLGSVFRL